MRLWRKKDLYLSNLYPIFVPAAFFSAGNWPGPYELSRVPGLGITWAVFGPEQMMVYISNEMHQHWDSSRIRWQDEALRNLNRATGKRVWTHELRRDNGTVYAVAMMHEDGAGPSRLFLARALEGLFPAGYLVALPDMSSAFAVSRDACQTEREHVEECVKRCFELGTRPLVRGLHQSCDLCII